MNNLDINFKSTSDGWRGKLAENFTFANVERLAKAISQHLIRDVGDKRIVIAYDTRFMSKDFATFMSSIFTKYGINVLIIKEPCTTPLLSFTTFKYKLPMGINITASHNPPFDNGIKIRMNYGGTPTKETTSKIESYLDTNLTISKNGSTIKYIDSRVKYINKIKKLANVDINSTAKIRVLVDTMHGSSFGLLKRIFSGSKIEIEYINDNFDPYFGGINPEPKFESTTELQAIIKSGKYNFGIAHDGDGDRIVAVLPKIGYLSPHDLSAMIVLYLNKYKGIKGKVLGSTTLGRKVKRVCERLNLEYETMPVGFRNATQQILDGKVLIASEENGGIGFGFYLPERDATLAASILVEAELKVGLTKLYKEVENIAGKSGFCRYNFTPNVDRQKLFTQILNDIGIFNYSEIVSENKLDGAKIIFENGEWLSIRYSGTEDILRIYCESDTRKKATKIKDFVIAKIQSIERKIK